MNRWLYRYTRNDDWLINNPWLWLVNYFRNWSVASDGAHIVAVQDGGAARCDNAKDVTTYVAPFLVPEPPADALRTTLLDLWQWLGVYTWVPCDACDGTGWFEGTKGINCLVCAGLGHDPGEDIRPGVLAGHVVSRNRLAFCLTPELLFYDRGPVLVWTIRVGDTTMIHLRGHQWRVTLGCVNHDGVTVSEWKATHGPLPTYTVDPIYTDPVLCNLIAETPIHWRAYLDRLTDLRGA